MLKILPRVATSATIAAAILAPAMASPAWASGADAGDQPIEAAATNGYTIINNTDTTLYYQPHLSESFRDIYKPTDLRFLILDFRSDCSISRASRLAEIPKEIKPHDQVTFEIPAVMTNSAKFIPYTSDEARFFFAGPKGSPVWLTIRPDLLVEWNGIARGRYEDLSTCEANSTNKCEPKKSNGKGSRTYFTIDPKPTAGSDQQG
ncbi:hypothetical protein ACWF95_23525 [Streptomyces vinaceus]